MEASPSVRPEVALADMSAAGDVLTSSRPPRRGSPVPAWLALAAVIVVAAHLLAGVTTYVTVELMHGVTPFAREARAFELSLLPGWRCLAFGGGIAFVIFYL